ncbi:MAG: class I SAM-dependent methyltransferase [Alphaproteobacteria bacterium]
MNEAATFAEDWLALREPADHRARSRDLTRRFAAGLPRMGGGGVRLVDLAAGSGANLRFLAPALAAVGAVEQSWRLVDRDRALLDAAMVACGGWASARGWRLARAPNGFSIDAGSWRAEVCCEPTDLALAFDGFALRAGEAVVASALLDLVSQAWIESLVSLCRRSGAPLLVTISDDGALGLRPAHAEDEAMRSLFAAHQRRDKGFGPALGPAAPRVLAVTFRRHGWDALVRRSPWRLGACSTALQSRTLAGIATAAAEQDPRRAGRIAAWLDARLQQAQEGRLRLVVGHRDVLAQPSIQARTRR